MANADNGQGQPHRPPESSQVSLPLLGEPSADKTIELGILRTGILKQLKLEDTPDNAALADSVVYDCVRRGLGERPFLEPAETISPIFAAGLKERMQIKAAYGAIIEGNAPMFIMSPTEVDLATIPHVSPRFGELEERLPLVEGRFAAVEAFQGALLGLPYLQTQATEIRPQASRTVFDPDMTPEQETLLANSRIISNLIAVVGLHKSPNLFVTAEDIATFRDIWNSDGTRHTITARVAEFMGNAAERLGLPRYHAESYAQALLGEIDIFFASHQAGFSEVDLRESPFVVVPQHITRRQEFSQQDLAQARTAFDALQTRMRARRGARRDMVIVSDIENVSPLDMYFIYEHLVSSNSQFDFTGLRASVEPETNIAILHMLQAEQYREMETGTDVAEFSLATRGKVYDMVKQTTMEAIARQDGMHPEVAFRLMQSLPFPVLFEYLGLYPDHAADIYALGDNVWIQVAKAISMNVTDQGDVIYPPGLNLYQRYFDIMPEEMRQRVVQRLRIIIE